MKKQYKSAYVLLKALPFHLGHKYLIDTAFKNSNKVTVLVGTLPSEPIPGNIRFEWIKETYKDNNKITIKWCNEILPQQPEEHINFWDIWVDVVKRYCPNDIDVIFSSELYGNTYAEKLGISSVVVDIDRKVVPVSGTLVRNNPFKYWDYIPEAVKPFFVKKIAIMGPESTGKTILTQNLAEYYNTEFVEEYGRTVYENQGNHVDIDDFIPISIGRQLIEDQKSRISNKLLFCDTEDITTYYLSKEYHPDIQKDEVDNFFINEINRKRKYDLYVLLNIDCDAVQDGTRSFLNKEIRIKQYNIIKKMLIDNNCTFVEVGGDSNNRFNESIKSINESFFS
jgi:HTH-type transcriptional repressor of NAD biosynthesis genes